MIVSTHQPAFPLHLAEMNAIKRMVMDDTVAKTDPEWWARREILDLLDFVHEQVLAWDADGDCGFPAYDHGKRILERLGEYVGKF